MNNYNDEQTVTVGDWLVTFLICMIPIANIIFIFYWAFSSSTKPSKANFFKAYLLMFAIFFGLFLMLMLVFGVALNSQS